MAKTEIRRLCTVCQKRNLCTYKKDGKLLTRCMTDGCKPQTQEAQPVQEQNTFIDSKKLEFTTPDSYRGISKQTLLFGGCRVAQVGSVTVTEYDHNNLDGTYSKKTGFRPSKAFMWEGKTDTTSMYLLDKCVDFTRPLYITEGGEDALSLWELGFQACSVHSAGSGIEGLELDKETLLKYPELIICNENDKAGKKVKKTIREMFSMKLLREVDLSPRKDANDWIRDDLLDQKPDREELINRLHKAKEILPKGVIFGDMISSEELRKPLPKGVQLPYPKLQEVVKGGILPGDLWLLCAGVSIGKSSVIRDFCADFQKQGLKIGNIFVEESKQVSQLNYIATELGYPIGDVLVDPTIIPQDQWDSCMNKILNTNDLMFIDEYWERTTDNLLKTIEYLAKVKKYDIIVLDHITAVVNSSGVGRGGKVHDIDWLMEQLFNLCRQTGVRLFIVSHLKRPQQPPYWDEGKKPSMYDLRGSGSLEGKPDVILGLSRNMKDEYSADVLSIEVLKNRWFSKLGMVDDLVYLSDSGRLILK